VAETPATARKINNLEHIHCVRDADAADEPGRKDVVVVRYDETIDRESSPVNPFGTGGIDGEAFTPEET
jgi:hypothetical protein